MPLLLVELAALGETKDDESDDGENDQGGHDAENPVACAGLRARSVKKDRAHRATFHFFSSFRWTKERMKTSRTKISATQSSPAMAGSPRSERFDLMAPASATEKPA